MKIFVNPLLWFLIIQFSLLAFIFPRDMRFNFAGYLFAISLLGLALFSLPITGYFLERGLALVLDKQVRNKPDYIFALGSGYRLGTSIEDDFLGEECYRRVLAATALWHQYPNATVVVSGASPEYLGRSPARMAQLMELAIEQHGVPASQIIMEPHSTNTREHPIEALKLPNITPQTPIAVVTSVWHMRRAQQEFNRYFKNSWYSPVPLNRDSIHWWAFIPNSYALGSNTTLFREWVGLAWYKL